MGVCNFRIIYEVDKASSWARRVGGPGRPPEWLGWNRFNPHHHHTAGRTNTVGHLLAITVGEHTHQQIWYSTQPKNKLPIMVLVLPSSSAVVVVNAGRQQQRQQRAGRHPQQHVPPPLLLELLLLPPVHRTTP